MNDVLLVCILAAVMLGPIWGMSEQMPNASARWLYLTGMAILYGCGAYHLWDVFKGTP